MHLYKADVVEAIKHVALQLRHLALTLPRPQDSSPPHLAAITPLLQGVVNESVPSCCNLHSLRIKDSQVDISILRDLQYLEMLSLAVSDVEALNVQLSKGFPSLKHLALDTSHTHYKTWDEFKNRWKVRPWALSPLISMMPISHYPMQDFCATIRNPLLNL